MNQSKPGYNTTEEHNAAWPEMSRQIIDFIRRDTAGDILDVGEKGYKSEQLGRIWNMHQLAGIDFNYPPDNANPEKYPLITCFEVMEHLANPLLFFYSLTMRLEKGGAIYISTPSRPRFLWPEYHFYEMSPEHLQKWIFEPCGFTIVRKKKLKIMDGIKWYFPLTGLRPFLRWAFWNYTWIYEVAEKK